MASGSRGGGGGGERVRPPISHRRRYESRPTLLGLLCLAQWEGHPRPGSGRCQQRCRLLRCGRARALVVRRLAGSSGLMGLSTAQPLREPSDWPSRQQGQHLFTELGWAPAAGRVASRPSQPWRYDGRVTAGSVVAANRGVLGVPDRRGGGSPCRDQGGWSPARCQQGGRRLHCRGSSRRVPLRPGRTASGGALGGA